MGLFSKKYCDVCGGEIKLLGNRKLEDGNLCKHCANKLSYWFDERRHSTVEQIKAQLAYREENKARVEAFNTTRTFGTRPQLVVDEDKEQFMIVRTSNLYEENPDVIDFSQVTACEVDIEEYRTEEKRKLDDGREVSFIPPQFEWRFDFNIIIKVNNPFFDDMKFEVGTVTINTVGNYNNTASMRSNPRLHPDYIKLDNMSNEIKDTILGLRKEARQGEEPKKPVKCSACGATTVPDASGCCEYCGSPLV